MDITPTPTPKSPEPETETPTRIQPTKPISFTNGVLKRHLHHHHHHHHQHPVIITYKECLKNHAASLGGHALDGCGEFMPSPSSTPSDPTSLKCAACGCHRNFHRRDPEDPPPTNATTTAIEYQPHHRHHPPPPPSHRSPNSASPPPISSAYYPSAPHMLLALSGSGLHSHPDNNINNNNHMGSNSHVNLSSAVVAAMSNQNPSSRKRFRTKFSQFQKDKMLEFAERVGWKMQKRDEDLIQEFCSEVGVDKGVLKVWMHNNKNTFGKRDINGGGGQSGNIDNNDNNSENNHNDNSNDDNNNGASHEHNLNHHQFESDSHVANVGTNGSSSSS